MSPNENDDVSPVQIEPVLRFLISHSVAISRENGVLALSQPHKLLLYASVQKIIEWERTQRLANF